MSNPSSSQPYSLESASLAQSIEFVATSRLQKGRSPEQIDSLFRKVDLLLDSKVLEFQKTRNEEQSVACKSGCSHCCYRTITSTSLEAIDTAVYIERSFSPGQKAKVKRRLQEYVRNVGPRMGRNLNESRAACPFLDGNLCSIYSVRPFACRSQFSTDASECASANENPELPFPNLATEAEYGAAVSTAFTKALALSGLWSEQVDFARTVNMALSDLTTCAHYLSGHPMYELAAVYQVPTPPKTMVSGNGSHHYERGQEPTGTPDLSVLAQRQFDLFVSGNPERAFSKNPTDGAVQNVFRIQTPMAYASEGDIDTWRESALTALEEFACSSVDPREKFDAIATLNPLAISYQQSNDLAFLNRLGDILTHEVAAKTVPDLCEPIQKRNHEGRLRVGYMGTGLDKSSGGFWSSGWLKNHSKEIETFVYYLNPNPIPGSEEFKRYANHYYHCPGPIPPIARMIKQHQLDVLIYPDASCEGRNIQFAMLRLAPVQCACWGGPETSGLPNMDYFLSGDWMEPEAAEGHYREKLIRLPKTGICYPKPQRSGSGLSKVDFGLDEGPLYLCLQSPPKLHPNHDHLLAEICEKSGRPIVFFSYPKTASHITEKRLKAAGVKALFMPFMNLMQFYDLVQLADVTLDTVGWSGGITTLLALQQNKPVITLPGEFRRGCHASAFLRAANASGLIATSESDYTELALNFDRQMEAMEDMNSNAVFDDQASVRGLDEFLFSQA